jgi:hypothetical protein
MGPDRRSTDLLASPSDFERRARALAALLHDHRVHGVLAWEDPAEVVLCHVVARELEVRSVRCFDHDGLVGLDAPLPEGSTLALVITALEGFDQVRGMIALADQGGRDVVAVGALEVRPGDAGAELAGRGIALLTLEHTDVSDG